MKSPLKKKLTETKIQEPKTENPEPETPVKRKPGRPKNPPEKNPVLDSQFSTNNEKLDELTNDYKNEKEITEEKRKPGRPSKKKQLEEDSKKEQARDFAKTFSVSAHLGLEILIKRINKNDSLTEEEKNTFDDSVTKVIEKYFDSVSKYGEEVNLIMISSLILFPRLYALKKEKEKETEKNEIKKAETN